MPGGILKGHGPSWKCLQGRATGGTGEVRVARSQPALLTPRAVIKTDTVLDPPGTPPSGVSAPEDASRGKATSTLRTLGR